MSRTLVYPLVLALCTAGFVLPLWSLCALGVLVAALLGRGGLALLLALVLDLLWGAPPAAPYITFPFVLLSVCGTLFYRFGAAYFFNRALPERL